MPGRTFGNLLCIGWRATANTTAAGPAKIYSLIEPEHPGLHGLANR
jgi:hypothetical protein